jgi:hypothetical protein
VQGESTKTDGIVPYALSRNKRPSPVKMIGKLRTLDDSA